jgi:PPOX class probable F420-dependent enzyme
MSFETAKYLTLGTFRKTGTRVDTPVWFAEESGFFYVLSNNQAGKIKRIKNGANCQIAPCTMLGSPTGEWQDSTAFIIQDSVEIQRAHNALKKKYGLQMLLLDGGAWLGGKINQRSFIKIRKP